jgi:hypothetical protein
MKNDENGNGLVLTVLFFAGVSKVTPAEHRSDYTPRTAGEEVAACPWRCCRQSSIEDQDD